MTQSLNMAWSIKDLRSTKSINVETGLALTYFTAWSDLVRRGGLVVEGRTPEREVGGFDPH